MSEQWRIILVGIALLLVLGFVARCWFSSDSDDPRTIGAATVYSSTEVRPLTEDELYDMWELSDRDVDYMPDPPDALPEGVEERFAETFVDQVGPSAPEGSESRFVFEIEEIIGPRSIVEAFGGGRTRNGSGSSDDRDDPFAAGNGDGPDVMLAVTLRGRVHNITQQDCRRLVFKASYRGYDGAILAIGEGIARDLQAQSRRGAPFEVHLTDWPPGLTELDEEGFRLYELRSRWQFQ